MKGGTHLTRRAANLKSGPNGPMDCQCNCKDQNICNWLEFWICLTVPSPIWCCFATEVQKYGMNRIMNTMPGMVILMLWKMVLMVMLMIILMMMLMIIKLITNDVWHNSPVKPGKAFIPWKLLHLWYIFCIFVLLFFCCHRLSSLFITCHWNTH